MPWYMWMVVGWGIGWALGIIVGGYREREMRRWERGG